MRRADWWRDAVIYEIYPRSFMDRSGDGVGDLAGITDKLDHVAGLGVDAIWIAPFFTSPMDDFGYDVADYHDVDPLFGSLEDFDALLERAHGLGLKVIIDLVLSHTSDHHPWFRESRGDRDNPRADWYVWADPRPDGTPPNNWLSVFGGAAWQWESRRRQYYLHNFLASQPDLNFHSPEVRAALLETVEFWLARGVDGFRLDTVNFYFHDRRLRDNPPRGTDTTIGGMGFGDDNPYAYQVHIRDKTQAENLDFLRELRALTERYPGTALLGEISSEDSLATMAEYTSGGDKLHMAYSFELLAGETDAHHVRRTVETLEARIGDGWPCWALSNHDVIRAPTRWGGPEAPTGLAKVLLAMLLSLRGSVCLYQGEELGLPEAEIPYEHLQDPYGLAFWPEFKGRDGCRTPMPWREHGVAAGFSDAPPWLPVPDQHRLLSVEAQEYVPGSVLNACRTFLHWRRDQPALRRGSIHFVDAPSGALAFTRRYGEQHLVACFNLCNHALTLIPPLGPIPEPLHGHGFAGALHDRRIELPAYGAFFGQLPIIHEEESHHG